MNRYLNLLHKKAELNDEIKIEKKRMHKRFVEINKRLFITLDILVMVIILFNMGAAFMTKAMVVKKTFDAGKELKVYEINSVVAEQGNYEPHPKAEEYFKVILVNLFRWSIMLFAYIYFRRTIYTEESLIILIGIIAFYFFAWGVDFFNDAGYFVGNLIYGT